ncbi:radical SAM/CxCxxxxC motif protein YfkAB [Geomicrobium halophilum]|uniref:Radical SAM/CxCxxxxC motif protein YfkAB n=1 Tax=Geomicrobium halophilum TaxID=549000 RepID=A0A841PPI8_9BACL|nr:radical SAM/CxCxxxxC motif protein YfkAB [Geomicrobium halophilum]MBB6450659.1 radical SAM/CxCxxxxC motif protein YfkAB [Geomicrobium halophilum]
MSVDTKDPITPANDPWEAYFDYQSFGKSMLTNVEFTTTTLCNMRCEHCAVGYMLNRKDPDALPFSLLKERLDEIKHLRALSITGGEPMLNKKSVDEYVVPLLRYAYERGARTQINSNLTLPLKQYGDILPYLDVLHISHNYGSFDDFASIGFAHMPHPPSMEKRAVFFERMIENARELSKRGIMVSAETMLNKRTLPHLEAIHDQIVNMGCQRHEVHPMYPSDFASTLNIATLPEIRSGIHRLLDHRHPNTWMLFGTLPFYACNDDEDDLHLLKRLYNTDHVTVRNDPDGRSRLNVNIFNGEVSVTDFGDEPSLGNIQSTSLPESFAIWQQTELAQSLQCHCSSVQCLGPNALVKDAYYKDVDFQKRKSKL